MTATSIAATFTYSHTVGFLAYRGRGFIHPVDLALGDAGAMYVLNRGGPETAGRLEHKRVCVCTVAEGYIGEWGTGGYDPGQFWWPSGIARARDGRLFITDEALQRVTIFDPDGRCIRHWGQPGSAPGQLNRPAAIAIAPDDSLLISDGLNHRIQRFTPDGEYWHGWGEYGAGPGQFNTPWGLACDAAGRVFVADWRNDRIQAFTPQGRFLCQWGADGDIKATHSSRQESPDNAAGRLHRPSSVAVDAAGYVYVADWGNERVLIFAPDSGASDDAAARAGDTVAAILRGDATTSSWAADYLAANPDEAAARRAANLSPAVTPWRDPGRETSAAIEARFWGPTSVTVDAAGRIYIVDSCRHRVQIYQANYAAAP